MNVPLNGFNSLRLHEHIDFENNAQEEPAPLEESITVHDHQGNPFSFTFPAATSSNEDLADKIARMKVGYARLKSRSDQSIESAHQLIARCQRYIDEYQARQMQGRRDLEPFIQQQREHIRQAQYRIDALTQICTCAETAIRSVEIELMEDEEDIAFMKKFHQEERQVILLLSDFRNWSLRVYVKLMNKVLKEIDLHQSKLEQEPQQRKHLRHSYLGVYATIIKDIHHAMMQLNDRYQHPNYAENSNFESWAKKEEDKIFRFEKEILCRKHRDEKKCEEAAREIAEYCVTLKKHYRYKRHVYKIIAREEKAFRTLEKHFLRTRWRSQKQLSIPPSVIQTVFRCAGNLLYFLFISWWKSSPKNRRKPIVIQHSIWLSLPQVKSLLGSSSNSHSRLQMRGTVVEGYFKSHSNGDTQNRSDDSPTHSEITHGPRYH